ncbi:MAG TPA: sulfate permease [Verrucomicrobiae bacterium]|nr:sulfate permease [Verrucomicrobiae bacterium]
MKMAWSFRPRLADTLKNYSREQFMSDAIAGFTVGIVALPLAMAFGIASGVTPQAGIFTAVVAGFIISALGGSRVQIGGPTGAFVSIVLATIVTYGLDNLYICTVLAGLMLLVMGFCKMGNLIKFIPFPVTMGFTCGIAVLIFSTQIKDFLGLQVEHVPGDFVGKLQMLYENIGAIDWPTVVLAVASIIVIKTWPAKLAKRVPGSIVALLLGTVVVTVCHLKVATIGSVFGGIPTGLPKIHLPPLSWEKIQHLIEPAFTIALLAAIESLLSAVVADGMIEDRHDSNQELIAQGLANIASPFFGGIPATGAIARTATNVRCGGRSPIAGITHAVTLLIIILVAAPLAKYIPLAVLSAVLVVVAYNMGEWHQFRRLRKWPRSDSAVFLVVFALTVFTDLPTAVKIGMVLAAALFVNRISQTMQITAVDQSTSAESAHNSVIGKEVPKGVMVYRVFGAFLFGAADKLETALKRAHQEPEILILKMQSVLAMDATGLNALEDIYEKLHRKGRHLILSGPHTQPLVTMQRDGFIDQLGAENVCPHLDAALERAREILDAKAAKNVNVIPKPATV